MKRMSILFDLDGTLVDSLDDLTAAVNATRHHFSLPPVTTAQTTCFIGDGQLNLVKRAFADADTNLDLQQPLQFLREYYRQHLLVYTRLFPGVGETLPFLAENCSLGVVTNKPQAEAEQVCQNLGITKHMSCIIGGGSTVNLKPHPEALLLALQQTGGQPENAWMVGDHYTDLAAAAAAGCKACFCRYGFGQTRDEHPDLSIDQFSELPKSLGLS
ncbi:MAG: HAD-IA family hydrolase [Lentisphaeria bacterium]